MASSNAVGDDGGGAPRSPHHDGFGGRLLTGANLFALLLVVASVAVVIAAAVQIYRSDRLELIQQLQRFDGTQLVHL